MQPPLPSCPALCSRPQVSIICLCTGTSFGNEHLLMTCCASSKVAHRYGCAWGGGEGGWGVCFCNQAPRLSVSQDHHCTSLMFVLWFSCSSASRWRPAASDLVQAFTLQLAFKPPVVMLGILAHAPDLISSQLCESSAVLQRIGRRRQKSLTIGCCGQQVCYLMRCS